MSFKGMEFKVDEDLAKRRHLVYLSIEKDPLVQEFMKEHQVDQNFIEREAYRFEKWIQDEKRVNQLTMAELEEEPSKGTYIGLTMVNDILSEVVYRSDKFLEIENLQSHLNRFKIFPIPKSLETVSLKQCYLNKDHETENTLKLIVALGHFIKNDQLGYYIYGNVGVGKSYLAAATAHEFALLGRSVIFVNVTSLMNQLKQLFHQPDRMERLMKSLIQVPLLVLDDLGSESITSWSRDEILLTILNDRLENRRKTVITSNYPLSQLMNLYRLDQKGTADDIRALRLVDRIEAMCVPYELIGENRRTKHTKIT